MDAANRHDAALLPPWLRRALIVVSALLMCSCRAPSASGQELGEPLPCPVVEEPYYNDGVGCAPCLAPRLVGPKDEYLCDGEDDLSPAAVTKDGQIIGLEQEDTVGVYTTGDGRVVVAPSSRVCIYAPRFGAVRQVIQPMGAQQRLFVGQLGDRFSPAEADRAQVASASLQANALGLETGELPPNLLRERLQPGEAVRDQKAAATQGLVGPYATLAVLRVGQFDETQRAVIADHALAAITWSGDQQVQVTVSGQGASAVFSPKHPGVLYQTDEPNRPRLRIVKLASTDAAHPGEEVEFTLRVDNVGDAPMDDVVIVDNLTSRLEFVGGSADASIEADFSAERNDRGSLVLRWELDAPLKPGDGGLLTFKARVR